MRGEPVQRRELPVTEWAKLAGTELETVWPALSPAYVRVLGVEDKGELIGCWAMMQAAHAEGLWVHPAHRGRASVGRHLLAGMREFARAAGVRAVFTAATDAAVKQMILSRGGSLLAGDHFMLPMEPTCQQP